MTPAGSSPASSWLPPTACTKRTFEDAQQDLSLLLAQLLDERQTEAAVGGGEQPPREPAVEQWWNFVGEAYSFDSDARIVGCLRDAYRQVTGDTMPIAGSSTILDVNRLVPVGGIPAVSLGFDTQAAHADYEFVRLARVEAGCRIALQTVLNFFGRSTDAVGGKSE